VTDQVKAWVDSVLEAEGTAEVERSRDPERAKEDARRRATALAYTALGRKVEALLLDEGVTVKGFLDQHPDLREPLNAALMQGKLVSESLDVEGVTYKVAVSLPAAAVARPLRLGRFREARGTVLMPEQAAMARENARADAASTLVKRISDLRTRSGITAGELIEKRASMKADIERLCRVAPIERVEITEDGMCKMFVSITTDMLPDEVRRLIVAEKPIRVFAIGAGLPVPPKKPEPPKPPAEKPPEQPAENAPAERPAEKPAENPAERPAQPGKAPG
jgi:YD repeat-containing protein